MESKHSFTYRSLFWPVLLIGAGVIWLLNNLGVIPQQNLCTLFSLWPMILIVIGLDLLFGRRSPVIGAIIGLVAVAAVVILLLVGPSIGLGSSTTGQLVKDHFTHPLTGVENAQVTLNLSSEPVYVRSTSGDYLIDATLQHHGVNRSSVSGSASSPAVTVDVEQQWGNGCWFITSGEDARWDIGLSPAVPLMMYVDAGSGSAELDLSDLKITNLDLNMGSGSMVAKLPANGVRLLATVDGGSGSLVMTLGQDTDAEITVDGGSGSIALRLDPGMAVRVEVRDSGSGSVGISGSLNQISKNGDDEGIWETSGYASAAHKVLVIVDGVGSGSISVNY